MQRRGNQACFLCLGKASSRSVVLQYPVVVFLCAEFSCFYTTGCEFYSFMTDGFGIFNVRTKSGCVSRTYTRRGVRHKQVCIRVDSEERKTVPHPDLCGWLGVKQQLSIYLSSPCPARGLNPGSSDLNSDSLTTELCPPYPVLWLLLLDFTLLYLVFTWP